MSEILLRVEGLSKRYGRTVACCDVNFELWPGEIVCLFGLVGAGRSELVEALFGVRQIEAGDVELGRRKVRFADPCAAARAGLGLVPEDRQRLGLHFNLDLAANMMLAAGACAATRRIDRAGERAMVDRAAREVALKAASLEALPDSLSGGNQQKVVVGKWVGRRPRVLVFDEPTQGVDVGAKAEIHRLVRRLADEGAAVMMISSDIEEIVAESDRVAVMHEGRITGILDRAACTPESIMQLAVA